MKRKTFFALNLAILSISACAIAFVAGDGEVFASNTRIQATSDTPSFILDKEKNALDEASPSSKSILSENGTAIELTLDGASSYSGYWGSLASSGYLLNKDIIHGLASFSVFFEKGALTLYYDCFPINPSYLEGVSSVSLSSSVSHSFGSEYPNYFLLKNEGNEDALISSINIVFDCQEHPLEFGRYPQSLVSEETLLSSLSSASDSDNDGYIEYEGEEYLRTAGSGKNGFSISNTYYFKVEPITWDYYDDGTLISEKVLDSSVYFSSDTGTRTIDEETVYPNNYMYSSARAYLNGLNGSSYGVSDFSSSGNSFISKAFTEGEKKRIEDTLVDNSAKTTNSESNAFACENTTDKIFLLSYKDKVDQLYFQNDAASTKKYTDYAYFQGLEMPSTKNKTAWWRLRSPDANYSSGDAVYVITDSGGRIGGQETVTMSLGLVPALKLL